MVSLICFVSFILGIEGEMYGAVHGEEFSHGFWGCGWQNGIDEAGAFGFVDVVHNIISYYL